MQFFNFKLAARFKERIVAEFSGKEWDIIDSATERRLIMQSLDLAICRSISAIILYALAIFLHGCTGDSRPGRVRGKGGVGSKVGYSQGPCPRNLDLHIKEVIIFLTHL